MVAGFTKFRRPQKTLKNVKTNDILSVFSAEFLTCTLLLPNFLSVQGGFF
jgi:hypothetical protein